MKTSSIRDAVALIEFADILERGMKCGVVYFLVTYLLLICCLFCLQVEIQGMKASSVRDAVALIEFADILERGMKSRVDWELVNCYLTFYCHILVTYLSWFIFYTG